MTDLDDLVSVYADPRREPWTANVLPRLRALAVEPSGVVMLAEASGLKPRAMRDVLAGRSRPRAAAGAALAALVAALPQPSGRRCTGCGLVVARAHARRQDCSKACREQAKYA